MIIKVPSIVQFQRIIMPRCACASEVYGSVFVCLCVRAVSVCPSCVCVCVCVCVCRPLQLLKDESSASKSFYRLLVMHVYLDFNSWICKIMLRSRVMPSFAYLECHCSLFRRVRSKTCSPSVTTLLSS